MSNIYSRLYLHFIFAVKHRQRLIPAEHKKALHKYVSVLVQQKEAVVLAVHCMPEHMHLLVSPCVTTNISQFAHVIKTETALLINAQRWASRHFSWQEGYGVFSYSHDAIETLITLINEQERFHEHTSFRKEYGELLEQFGVAFDERYLFDLLEQPLNNT